MWRKVDSKTRTSKVHSLYKVKKIFVDNFTVYGVEPKILPQSAAQMVQCQSHF